jgi:CelD/BcsL family acetyltransferase involved in cellulose biosynthesis
MRKPRYPTGRSDDDPADRELLGRAHTVNGLVLMPAVDVRKRLRMLSPPRRLASPAAGTEGAGTVRIRVIRSVEELTAFAPAWHALFAETGCSLPFLHFSWIDQWWRAFGSSFPFMRNELAILVAEDGQRSVGILPFYVTAFGASSAFSMRYIRPLGSDANLTEVRTALICPGYETAVLAAAEQFFAQHAERWDLLNWGSYRVPLAPGSTVPGHWCSVDRHDPIELFSIVLPSDWDAFAGGFKRNTRESVRRAHNALKRDGRTVTFRCLTCANDILPMLPQFFELHRRRAELKGTVRHPDVFARVAHRSFLRGLTGAMADQGLLKLFVLEVDGTVVALRLGFRIGGTLYCYYSGFDPTFAKYSVMTRLFVEMLRWAMGQDLRLINLSTGRDQSKLRWNPEVVRFQTYSQIGGRFRSRLACALFAPQ